MNTESRIMARRAAKGGAILLALIGVGIWVATLAGCGNGSGEHGSGVAAADAGTASSEHPGGTTPAPVATAAGPQAKGTSSYAADSLPPDVMITSSDLEGVRGQPLEVNARGSDDVVEVVLKDGLGKPQAFTYDASLKEWRVIYRVPFKTAGERLALSVTAKNGAGRYCRVWLFPQVTDGQQTPAEPQATPAEPDSGKEK
jgi:hypothetical protein